MPTPTKTSEALKLDYDWLFKKVVYFFEQCKFKIEAHTISENTLNEIVERYNNDMARLGGPNIFKQAGYLTFWFRKLKPLNPDIGRVAHVNEVFAYYLGRALINSVHDGMVASAKRANGVHEAASAFQKEFCYSLRYRPISPHAVGMIYFAIWNLQASVVARPRPKTS